ncbi:unnamed protein product, partial [Urochloa humidicola]
SPSALSLPPPRPFPLRRIELGPPSSSSGSLASDHEASGGACGSRREAEAGLTEARGGRGARGASAWRESGGRSKVLRVLIAGAQGPASSASLQRGHARPGAAASCTLQQLLRRRGGGDGADPATTALLPELACAWPELARGQQWLSCGGAGQAAARGARRLLGVHGGGGAVRHPGEQPQPAEEEEQG